MTISRSIPVIAGVMLTLAAYFTYVVGYDYPKQLFWDENYHIASAQRYLTGTHFLENHPPLGKLFIALGEKLLNASRNDDVFAGTTHIKEAIPPSFSFRGYRLFPVLFGWLTTPLIFLTLYILTGCVVISTFLTCAYIFDNALIVHSRGAMLESTQLFFTVSALLICILLAKGKFSRKTFFVVSLILGAVVGCAFMTKLTSLVLILLAPFLFWRWSFNFTLCSRFIAGFFAGFFSIFVAIWHIHFGLGARIDERLDDKGYFTEDVGIRSILENGRQNSLIALPTLIKYYYLEYMPRYNKRVPRLNLCKTGENGSPPYFWPLGARSIAYRWERPTADTNFYMYLYLQCNPLIWWSLFILLLGGAALAVGDIVFGNRIKSESRPFLLLFLTLYIGYMTGVLFLERVMYLYHYFIPLLFSLFVSGIVLDELIKSDRINSKTLAPCLGIWAILSAMVFNFYSPLTYYRIIYNDEVARRAILPLWDLRCQGCKRTNLIADPESVPKPTPTPTATPSIEVK